MKNFYRYLKLYKDTVLDRRTLIFSIMKQNSKKSGQDMVNLICFDGSVIKYTANKLLQSNRIFTIEPQRGISNSIGQRPMYKANNTNQP